MCVSGLYSDSNVAAAGQLHPRPSPSFASTNCALPIFRTLHRYNSRVDLTCALFLSARCLFAINRSGWCILHLSLGIDTCSLPFLRVPAWMAGLLASLFLSDQQGGPIHSPAGALVERSNYLTYCVILLATGGCNARPTLRWLVDSSSIQASHESYEYCGGVFLRSQWSTCQFPPGGFASNLVRSSNLDLSCKLPSPSMSVSSDI